MPDEGLVRLWDWPSRLDVFLEGSRSKWFAYGLLDCGLFTCDAVLAMTGRDMADWVRGRYRNRTEALHLVREHVGSTSVMALVEKVCGDHQMPEVDPLRMQRGDVALIRRGSGYSMGIMDLNGREIVTPAKVGLAWVPLARIARGWRV
jgi:hypothetical protein